MSWKVGQKAWKRNYLRGEEWDVVVCTGCGIGYMCELHVVNCFVVAHSPLVAENKLAGRSGIPRCRRHPTRRQYHSRPQLICKLDRVLNTRANHERAGAIVQLDDRQEFSLAGPRGLPAQSIISLGFPLCGFSGAGEPTVGNGFFRAVAKLSHPSLRVSHRKCKIILSDRLRRLLAP